MGDVLVSRGNLVLIEVQNFKLVHNLPLCFLPYFVVFFK